MTAKLKGLIGTTELAYLLNDSSYQLPTLKKFYQ